MSLRLSHTTWDAIDPHTIAEFWRRLLEWEIHEPDSYHPGSDECYLISPLGSTILFYRVSDPKRIKNRAHMDLAPHDSTRDAEITRAIRLGAAVTDDRRHDLGWAVMSDPEGNEFCILESGA